MSQQKGYCIQLVATILNEPVYKENHRFDFLRGDSTHRLPNGVPLPVNAYYPKSNIALEFRERQHYSDSSDLGDRQITGNASTRKTQRRKYDERRERVLPAHGIRLLVIYDYQLKTDKHEQFVKGKIMALP